MVITIDCRRNWDQVGPRRSGEKKERVEQIADAISQLRYAQGQHAIEGLDLSRITSVYPLLLTLDSLGGSLLMSMLLNTFFDEFVNRSNFGTWSVRPLFCTDIESLEVIIPFGDIKPISSFLEHWLQNDEKLGERSLRISRKVSKADVTNFCTVSGRLSRSNSRRVCSPTASCEQPCIVRLSESTRAFRFRHRRLPLSISAWDESSGKVFNAGAV